jgi:glycine cleavage system H protein
VGISDHAQGLLGDLVYVELPEVGERFEANTACAVVESVKAASDVYAPLSGEVLERNVKVIESPELVNTAPYGSGWLLKVRLADRGELNALLSPADYRAHIGESAGSGGD